VIIIAISNSTEKPEQKRKWTKWIFLLGFVIVGIIALLAYSNLPILLNIQNPLQFQTNLQPFAIFCIIIYVLAFVLNFWLKDKYSEWTEKEGPAIKIMESHKIIPKIREYAYNHYNLKLGECIKIQGLMPHKEAGSAPTTRFFLFENIEYNEVNDYSMWVVNYFRIINIHLFKRFGAFGKDSGYKYWTGEYRNEQHQSIAETTAGKQKKEIENVREEHEDKSITEED
jgi:uncharacterized membrane protein SirB2